MALKNLKFIMKKILFLLFVFSLLSSCKQTQLTSNFNKRSKKIYIKPTIKSHYIDVTSIKDKTANYSKRKSIETIVKNSFNSIEITNKEELLANVDVSEPNGFLKENKIQQKLIRVDSILNTNNPNLSEKEEILELSKKAKKFSLIGLFTGLISMCFILLQDSSLNNSFNLFGHLGVSFFLSSTILLNYIFLCIFITPIVFAATAVTVLITGKNNSSLISFSFSFLHCFLLLFGL